MKQDALFSIELLDLGYLKDDGEPGALLRIVTSPGRAEAETNEVMLERGKLISVVGLYIEVDDMAAAVHDSERETAAAINRARRGT